MQGAAPDLGPLVAIAAALLLARFVVWGRLSRFTVAIAVASAFLWAIAAHRWGGSPPTLVAAAVTWLLARGARSAEAHRWPGDAGQRGDDAREAA